FYAFGIGGMVLGLLLMWRLKDTPHEVTTEQSNEKSPSVFEILKELSGKPTVFLLAIAFAGMAFVDIGYVTWMPTYLQENFAMTKASAGFSSMFYHHFAAFIGILAAGRFTDIVSRKRRSIRIEAQM